jgi:hypothetical protein
MAKKIFDSEILNDALSEGLIVNLPEGIVKMSVRMFHNLSPDAIVIEVFPAVVPVGSVDSFDKFGFGSQRRKEKDKIIYRLKKEGFIFVSLDGINGHYVK